MTLALGRIPEDVNDILYIALLGVNLLLAAYFLFVATSWIAKLKIKFNQAFMITFIGWLIGAAASFAIIYNNSNNKGELLIAPYKPALVSQVVTFLVIAAIAGFMIKNESKQPIGFGKGSLIALVQALLTSAATLAILFLIYFLSLAIW